MELEEDIRYIAEGSFGCVFSSKIKCKDVNIDESKKKNGFVSKVSVSSSDENLDKEIIFGKKIAEEVSQYDYYFGPILKSCPVDIGVIDDEEIKKCELVSNDKKAKEREYVSSTLKYIGKNSVYEFLDLEKKSYNSHVKKMFETHLHLIIGLEKLLGMEDPLVHYDLKNGNVMFDDVYNVPIIIDFGLSYTRSDLLASPMSLKILDRIFYVYYEKYPAWNVEIVLLSYIIQSIANKENININSQILKPYYFDLLNVVEDFIKGSVLFEGEDEIMLFTKETHNYLSNFKNKAIHILIDDLRRKWKSWDNYSIAVMYYSYLQENEHLYENRYVVLYRKLLKEIILSTPKDNRQEPFQTREKLVSITRT